MELGRSKPGLHIASEFGYEGANVFVLDSLNKYFR